MKLERDSFFVVPICLILFVMESTNSRFDTRSRSVYTFGSRLQHVEFSNNNNNLYYVIFQVEKEDFEDLFRWGKNETTNGMKVKKR